MRYKWIHKAWNDIREKAGMPWLRIHDLRHAYASILVSSGRTLYEVQQLLGHRDPQVTQRYAHLSNQALLSASEVASQKILAATPRLLTGPVSQAS
jgi:site-specific recombinase XerD